MSLTRRPIERRPQRRLVSRIGLPTLCFIAAASWAGIAAGSASAGWSPARTIEPGTDSILSIGPSGNAALGSNVLAPRGFARSAYVAVLRPRRGFGRTHRFGRIPGGLGPVAEDVLLGVAAPRNGATVAVFGPEANNQPAPIDAFVKPSAPGTFGAPQQLIGLGNASDDTASGNTTTMVTTTRDEVVEAGQDDSGRVSTATLEPGRRRFAVTPGAPADLSGSDGLTMATDGVGGTFLAGDGADGCTTVAYRRAHGRFATTYHSSDCASSGPNVFQGIVGLGLGYSALLTEDLNQSGAGPTPLYAQTGRYGRFGEPQLLTPDLGDPAGGSVSPGPIGMAADRDGAVTVAWRGCNAGQCGVYAETGSIEHGFYDDPTLVAAVTPGVRLGALVADGAVLVQSCSTSRQCIVGVSLARRGGDFPPVRKLTGDSHGPLSVADGAVSSAHLCSDPYGNLLVVYSTPRGTLYATTRAASAPWFRASHRLSGSSVSPATLSCAYGPRGEAIVAWSRANHVIAAVHTLTVRAGRLVGLVRRP